MTVALPHWKVQYLLFHYDCDRPWPAAYITFMQITHQIQVLTEPLCHAQAIFYSLPNNKWDTKYRGLTYRAKQTGSESVRLPIARSKLVCKFDIHKVDVNLPAYINNKLLA